MRYTKQGNRRSHVVAEGYRNRTRIDGPIQVEPKFFKGLFWGLMIQFGIFGLVLLVWFLQEAGK